MKYGNETTQILTSHKIHIGGIFCDFAEACDCVSHEMLLAKYHFYDIQGTVCNWFISCHTDRK
jgi:hypothetical protein